MGESAPHAARRHKAAHALTRPETGPGSRIDEGTLIRGAQAYLDQEERSSGRKVSALAVGKALSLSVAPEWLQSTRFLQVLDVERFRRKILRLAARPELTSLIQELMDLGMLEAQKRLIMSPGAIPDTVLFGDILHKWPKMLQDFTAGAKPTKAGDVYIQIVKEINLMSDPAARERARQSLLGKIDGVAKALNPVELTDAHAMPTGEIVDAELLVGDGTPGSDDHIVDEPVSQGHPSVDASSSDDPTLWSDPALN